MEALELLKSKLDLLLKKYTTSTAENKRLNSIIAAQNDTIDALNKKLHSLEQGMVSVNFDKMGIDGEEKENMRRQLDTVINEIDKILVTLND